jgi:hypothetical protein
MPTVENEVAVLAGFTLPQEGIVGSRRHMRRCEREVKKERLRVLGAFFDVPRRALADLRQYALQTPSRPHLARPAEHLGGLVFGGLLDDPVVLDERVGRKIREIDAEIIVEASRRRSFPDRFRKYNLFRKFVANFTLRIADANLRVHFAAVGGGPVPAQMPFANSRGVVAERLKHPPHGQPVLFDQRLVPWPQHLRLQFRAPRIPPGQKPVACRRADAARGVRIRELHSLAGEAVDVGSGYAGIRIIHADVAVAEIVGKDDNDVRAIGALRGQAECRSRGRGFQELSSGK